jgi:tetratricopeptide (TPR) repeat protein
LFFGLLEGVLAIAGVEPVRSEDDPFVGFASNVPLFSPRTEPDGRQVLATTPDRRLFNPQQFPREKAPGTYRIFCVGGSTTFGRPYDDTTSFAGWMRELLPVADPVRRWEVINAGGVSYASYRVAHLMKELAQYEPDLFVVYSGHNEFLEERSYGVLRDTPAAIRWLGALFARTRTWASMSLLLSRMGLSSTEQGRLELAEEADTMLEHFGPEIYERDDALKEQVLGHYRLSLTRMVRIAESAGADVMFVTPASNLKNCSPFKSQHTDGLGESDRARSKELLVRAHGRIRDSKWRLALELLDEAIAVDPRFAELHYRRGKALLALDEHAEAKVAFERAREEDVCPLRALVPMQEMLAGVAKQTGSALIDFVDWVEQRLLVEAGHIIAGEEYFLDHVHLTIEANRMLAIQLLKEMIEAEILEPADSWGDPAIEAVASRIEAGLDPGTRALALSNLAQVLAWSGKIEDASRLAQTALDFGVDDPEIVSPSASVLATHYGLEGNTALEQKYFRMALNAEPRNPELHFRLGLRRLDHPNRDPEMAAGHIFFATVFWSGARRDEIHQILGGLMAQRQQFSAAFSHLLEAERLNPDNTETQSLLERVGQRLGANVREITTPKISLEEYPSGTPRKIVQVKLDASGRAVPEGIWTEWYESGELKRFVDYADGVPHGVEVIWNPAGGVISLTQYQHGTRNTAMEQ